MILQKKVYRPIYMGLVLMGLLFNSSVALAAPDSSSTSALQKQSCTHLCSHECLTCRQSGGNYGSTLALDESDNGKSFTIKPGAYVTVTLEENPSTGYHWQGYRKRGQYPLIEKLSTTNMPRKARFFISKIPVHLVIRGNSRKTKRKRGLARIILPTPKHHNGNSP
jgi:hypothetical protein